MKIMSVVLFAVLSFALLKSLTMTQHERECYKQTMTDNPTMHRIKCTNNSGGE